MDMVGRKAKQPSESERRRGFLPDSGNWVRDQGEKAKGRTSVGRKVPSSRAFLDETLWLITVGCDGLGQEAEGEVIGRNPVVVLGNLDSPAKLPRDC